LITLPVIIGLKDWADQIVLDLSTYGVLPQLDDETKWQEWAASLCAIASITSKNPPDALSFSDWREWASRFAQIMN